MEDQTFPGHRKIKLSALTSFIFIIMCEGGGKTNQLEWNLLNACLHFPQLWDIPVPKFR